MQPLLPSRPCHLNSSRQQSLSFEERTLDLERDLNEDYSLEGALSPSLMVNNELQMTTGKTAAQVAHGLMLWALNMNNTSTELLASWAHNPGLHLSYISLSSYKSETPYLVVTDKGHTELEPGSITVRVEL